MQAVPECVESGGLCGGRDPVFEKPFCTRGIADSEGCIVPPAAGYLKCDNAYTEVPYIDLVCEILEDQVFPDPGLALDAGYTADLVPGAITNHLLTALTGAKYNITASAILYPSYTEGTGMVTTYILRDSAITVKIAQVGTGWNAWELRQTHRTSAELLASPEYVNANAYTLLQGSDISFLLPFDLYQQEGEALLENVGVQRADLMNAFKVPAGIGDVSIAAVALGIPPAEAMLIINADPANQFVYWNTSAAALLTTVNEVDVFLQKSNFQYTDLQNLLALSFINPGNSIYIQHGTDSCDPATKHLINLDLNALDRMHRFIRLWRRTGLSMINLNRVISYPALGNLVLDGNVLLFLYGLQNIERALGISPEQALSFYGLMADDNVAALYQTTFLNLRVTNPVDSAFTISNILANESLPPGTQDTLANHLNTLCQSLRRKPADINFLISQLSAVTGVLVPVLSRANLAFLYCNSVLASALSLSLTDLYNLSNLSGQALFTSPDGTLSFIQTARFISGSGFSVTDLEWFLLSNDPSNLNTITDADITTLLQGIQASYQSAYAGTSSPFVAAASPDENINGLKQMVSALPGMQTANVNQLISVVNDNWTNTALTAQQFIQNIFGGYFSPAVITALQGDVTTLQAAAGGAIPVAQNVLIGDICANASQYLFTGAKNAALYAAVAAKFGTGDALTQIILDNADLHFPVLAPVPSLTSLLTSDSLIDKVNTPPQSPVITPAAFDNQFRGVRLLNMMVAYYNKITP